MTTHKEALTLALEALTATMSTHGFKDAIEEVQDKAITAIKEALAQPEQPKQNTVEAVKTVLKGIDQTEIESPDGWWETSAGAEFGAKKLKYVIGLLAQPEQLEGLQLIHKADIDLAKKRATEAQPEQEPVANGYVFVAISILEKLGINKAVIDTIATTPPQRRPLNIKTIKRIATYCGEHITDEDVIEIIRRVEEEHKIKE